MRRDWLRAFHEVMRAAPDSALDYPPPEGIPALRHELCAYLGRVRGGQQAWVASEAGGRWGRAEEVPGTAALNAGGNAAVTSVSCTAGATDHTRGPLSWSPSGTALGAPRPRCPA